jgi:Clp amino terminal domain, pathogenicity island component/NTF2 fold immunity protein
MFERYTERARRVIFFARYEASQFGSTTIETEHLLLGLLREDGNIPTRFVPSATAPTIRKEIQGRLDVREKVSTSIDLPLSNEGKRILAYAAEETERLNHRYIGTEHLLLGILREEKCVAAKILFDFGLRLNAIREQLARSPIPPEESPMPPEARPLVSSLLSNPTLPKGGVVPDAETARRIAEAVWLPLYGVEVIAEQTPFEAELKHNVWIVIGSRESQAGLFVFILQQDGRILSIGRGNSGTVA